MNDFIEEDKSLDIEPTAEKTYLKILNNEAYCHFSSERITMDNLHALFTLDDGEYRFCCNLPDSIAAYEVYVESHYSD